MFWGLSGTVAQVLFVRFGFPTFGLASIRMLVAGVAMLLWLGVRSRPQLSPSFLAQSIFGLALPQVAYFEAIQLSNALTATLLLFLFLPIVAGYEMVRHEIAGSLRWGATTGLAGLGTTLLLVDPLAGSLGVQVTPGGMAFGLLSAVAVAYYTLAARSSVRSSGPWPVTAWGLLLGGLASLPFGTFSVLSYSPPSHLYPVLLLIGLVGFVVVFGTIFAYGLYLIGLRHLSATEVGVAASAEPISAGVATYLILGIALTTWQYAGGGLIVIAVILLGIRASATPGR